MIIHDNPSALSLSFQIHMRWRGKPNLSPWSVHIPFVLPEVSAELTRHRGRTDLLQDLCLLMESANCKVGTETTPPPSPAPLSALMRYQLLNMTILLLT